MTKNIKLTFAPGCFDNFEGTQEELDALIKEITDKAEDGTLLEEADTIKELDPTILDLLLDDDMKGPRTLQ
jgi:hypothetical protein